jgi:hypothetical protein
LLSAQRQVVTSCGVISPTVTAITAVACHIHCTGGCSSRRAKPCNIPAGRAKTMNHQIAARLQPISCRPNPDPRMRQTSRKHTSPGAAAQHLDGSQLVIQIDLDLMTTLHPAADSVQHVH